MKDLLFQMDRDWIRKHLESTYDGRFCRIPVSQEPELSGEGQKILFSDGDKVIAESVITEIRSGEVRFEPLTAVRKPNPESPPGNGFEYVDAEECGRYSIRFHGVEHVYKTLHDLIEALLEKREEMRNSEELLCHTVWSRVQDLDLNRFEEFEERMDRGTIVGVRDEFQVEREVYPPTDPEELVERYRGSSRATRMHGSLRGYVEKAKEFYREKGRDTVADRLDAEVQFPDEVGGERSNEIVKERVQQVSMEGK
ncbi:hypothetical protein ACM16X_02670 [Haloarcula japonica]|uniref:hypothetical protein n=1 Tax=Haloarcula japonica TaxID=29282 RepID=UPI0039F6B2B4